MRRKRGKIYVENRAVDRKEGEDEGSEENTKSRFDRAKIR